VSQREPVELAEGKHYENTFECWQRLCVASRDARHLDLVPADWWTDKKSAFSSTSPTSTRPASRCR
jgi:hypothetical protein